MSDARLAGSLAFREGVSFEMNPHVPGGPDVAERCRVMDWPTEAREWHGGWREAATLRADAASQGRTVS